MAKKANSKPTVNLSVGAYEFMLQKLVSWQYQPGDILVEADIASQLGVSRTPVREALRTLVAEGFLRVVPRTGYMVLPLRPEEVREIYHMRLLLEGEAAALAARRINEVEVQEIIEKWRSRLKEIAISTAEAGEPRPVTPEDNTPFHLAIARISGSSRLVEAVDRLLQDSLRVMAYYKNQTLISALAEDHLAILDAICTGNPEHARATMRQHIEMGIASVERWFGFSRQTR
jgi:DNA-binding GntR family transcriptional regulator